MIRLYICGSHSCGKTTLANELSKRLGWIVVPEAARDVIEERGFVISDFASSAESADEFQNRTFELHIKRHTEFQEKYKDSAGLIFDRGPDGLVYSSHFSTTASEQMRWPRSKEYLDSLRDKDAVVILVDPHEDLIESDGVRKSLSMAKMQSITDSIACLLEWEQIRYFRLTSSDLLVRLKNIAAILWHKGIET